MKKPWVYNLKIDTSEPDNLTLLTKLHSIKVQRSLAGNVTLNTVILDLLKDAIRGK